MSTEVLLPKLGFSMNDGMVTEWRVADGGPVTQGQLLYLLESEKSVQEIEAPVTGTLRIKAPVGETLLVGTLLAVIE